MSAPLLLLPPLLLPRLLLLQLPLHLGRGGLPRLPQQLVQAAGVACDLEPVGQGVRDAVLLAGVLRAAALVPMMPLPTSSAGILALLALALLQHPAGQVQQVPGAAWASTAVSNFWLIMPVGGWRQNQNNAADCGA